ncbi:PREDICTED: ABC transporter G family member 23-like [Dufourea novaeangliae]|uniref:ABC transporter G family member 23-like n=1 Tax=Dufourea novaeangliae TaxID=178035 RepID=UPI0007677A2B|nr:PREDICTED: ABC transporter G family member 23-like [Dufourea novaeangliae]
MVVEQAIIVRDAKKRYGSGTPVLNGFNLNVPKGCIYGLLGPSGCGKTTLLSSLVGVRKMDSGELWVLGGKPGTVESGITRVGYMPQEISLVDEFSVIGALYFFGRINGMEDYTIEDRYLFLKDLLQLPPRDRLVRNMSGGQQRRVSFAAALVHQPELLILDEPTVGLDPVLRDNIWDHLVKITRDEGVTVIITTHYIEEAKQCNKIGLMRCGQLLAESSPSELLEQCQTDSLEEAFLSLSQMQAQNQGQAVGQTPTGVSGISNVITLDAIYRNYPTKNTEVRRSSTKKKCHALLMKNALQFLRHPGGVLFSVLLPILQVTLFFNSYGLDPKDLAISVVNEEAGNCNHGRNRGNVTYNQNEFTCNFVDLSCRFTGGFNDSLLKKLYYDDYSKAVDEITTEHSVGVMHFSRNFSYALQAKLDDFLSISDADLIAGQIDVSLHTPDRQIGLFVQKELFEMFQREYKKVLKECGITPKFADVPIHFEDPVYGKKDQKYITFITAPFILSLVFILATSISSSIIITDRHSGVWDRSLVQGVTTAEILITHLISQVIVIVIQVAAALCISFLQFDVECKGSLATVIWLGILDGVCGMSYGFLISVMCTSTALVNYASVGSFYPLVLLCGLIWPVEGMPKFLRWFSLSLPLTLPGISLRGVLEKGSSVNEPEVYQGFLVLAAWIVGFISLCLFQLRSKST